MFKAILYLLGCVYEFILLIILTLNQFINLSVIMNLKLLSVIGIIWMLFIIIVACRDNWRKND